MIEFLSKIPLKDIVDIILVVLFLYEAYLLVRKTGTRAIFMGVLAFLVIWIIVSQVFQLRMIGAILDRFISVGFILLVIVFQKEIREFLQVLGSNKGIRFIADLFETKKTTAGEDLKTIIPIVMAVMDMSQRKEGALIAVEQTVSLDAYVETGETLNADINARLIENIFFKNSPLHDGAMIISGKKIIAAGCILPVSQDLTIPKYLGLRHRSGLGLSQETDAKVIIVSEETGQISIAHSGKFIFGISAERLQMELTGK
ncbi:MAG: diadenylate cyclase CdaA [Dysgonamonadaceae bacterium]|jgi:uncharacterized protein (TIGR00159 family)|nr:diadenylate cyclase CdaA [Dysgonamonadaceae bacterium]